MRTVKDIMTRTVVSVAPNALIEDALETMLQHRISGLPVIDEEGTLAGIITEYDALSFLSEENLEYSPIAPVVHFMSSPVEAVEEDATLQEVTDIFRELGMRRLPVLRHGKLVGIVSRRDLVRVIHEERRRAATEMMQGGEAVVPIRWVQMPDGTPDELEFGE